MKAISRSVVCLILIFAFLSSAMPCGPGYISPLFDTTSAPENPYTDFAAGRLGIVKPEFHRSVLIAAYRWIAGNGLNAAEQQAIVEVWKAEIEKKDFADGTIDEAVKAWVDRRKEIVGEEEKIPDIYVERAYGGYDFFPNCTKNAFETAAETLSDRSTAHGRDNQHVKNWVKAQDQVFENCSSGKRTPDDAPTGAPEWLQKDRAYQKAAAEFYSLDYADAKKHFAEIAHDSDSAWQETADYLVARTLIRQASLSKTPEKAAEFYDEAETHLQKFTSRSGKFSASAERMLGLIAYRRHPKERVCELAKKLTVAGNDNFRQDVIDYTWLLDKFENEILSAEEKRKREEEERKLPPCSSAMPANTPCRPTNTQIAAANQAVANAMNDAAAAANAASNAANTYRPKRDDELGLYFHTEDKSWHLYVKHDATDEEVFAEAEKMFGHPPDAMQKEQLRSLRQNAYSSRFTDSQKNGYEGGYWGEETLKRSLMPEFLRKDDLTDWLFTYQMSGAEAYLYALNRFKETGSDLWLLTALSKADKSSTQLPRLFDAASRSNTTAPGSTTIVYHQARILLEQGKTGDARKLMDAMLNAGDQIPISARNSFLTMRLKLAETLEDFLRFSLKRPYAFDFDGDKGTIEEFIAEQKSWYDPENAEKQTREEHDAEIEARFKEELAWQGREMFDTDTIEVFNQHFPTPVLIDVMRSPALPDYVRERFAVAIWTRAFLLDDFATLLKITPDLARYRPEMAEQLEKVSATKTQAALDHAALYFVLKNPLFSPYIEDGMGKTDNEQEQWDANDWWCEPYDSEYSDTLNAEVPKGLPPRPKFLTDPQSKLAQSERKRLKKIGDAPKYLAEKVMEWAKRYPADRRVPEALYIMIEANGWTKYGCGNNEELRDEMSTLLKKRYPNSEWTQKLRTQESEQ